MVFDVSSAPLLYHRLITTMQEALFLVDSRCVGMARPCHYLPSPTKSLRERIKRAQLEVRDELHTITNGMLPASMSVGAGTVITGIHQRGPHEKAIDPVISPAEVLGTELLPSLHTTRITARRWLQTEDMVHLRFISDGGRNSWIARSQVAGALRDIRLTDQNGLVYGTETLLFGQERSLEVMPSKSTDDVLSTRGHLEAWWESPAKSDVDSGLKVVNGTFEGLRGRYLQPIELAAGEPQ